MMNRFFLARARVSAEKNEKEARGEGESQIKGKIKKVRRAPAGDVKNKESGMNRE